MIRRALVRHWFGLALAILVAGVVVSAGFLVTVALPDLTRTSVELPTPSPTVAPSPTPPSAMSPIGIQMPANADCAACHLTSTGTVGTKAIPAMAHPLWGWTDCTACHAPDRLVTTAPGHSGLHKDQCLICHEPPSGATATQAPMRPEHMGNTQPCTSCHGLDQHAPMPANMKDRGNNCWICHNGPEFTYLFQSPSPSPSPEAADAPATGASTVLPPLPGPATGFTGSTR